jgi:predicted nucleotidyltransferase
MPDDLATWVSTLASWAANKPQIAELWLYGSRVRGDHRDNSDLDVAVVMAGNAKETRYGNWVALAGKWERELAPLVPVTIDLDIGDKDISQTIVSHALRREGRKVYCRSENV